MDDFIVGNIVKGKVTGIESYGIFVKLENDFTGLIHISEITNNFVKNVNNYAKIGEEVYAKIIDVDNVNKKLRLSVKGLNYKVNRNNQKIKESVRGFSPLQESLPRWTEETLKSFE